jgi:NADH-quinone oxidoreductase subunit H
VNLVNGGLWAVTSDWTGAAGIARWVVSALLVVVPFVVLGRSLTAGYGPRTYRYASP